MTFSRSLVVSVILASAACGDSGANDSTTEQVDSGMAKAKKDAGQSPIDGGSKSIDSAAPRPDGSSAGDDGDASANDAGVAPLHDAAVPNDGGAPKDAGPVAADKIVAGYYPNWTPSPVRIRDIDSHYNLIYLFAAKPVGGAPGTTGAITWDAPGDGRGAASNLNADIAFARASQGRKIILSIGGAGAGMSFPNRAKSQTFLNSVIALNTQFGGIDGIDWNTFEGSQAPDTTEMIWISQQLKSKYPGFLITAPPAPWNSVDKTFCSQMVAAGALDYAAPQYYDGPNLATQSYITTSIDEWSKLLGEDRVVVGFGIWDQPNYMTIGDAVSTWNAVDKNHPKLRGAFDWQIHIDESNGWSFAKQVGPLVSP